MRTRYVQVRMSVWTGVNVRTCVKIKLCIRVCMKRVDIHNYHTSVDGNGSENVNVYLREGREYKKMPSMIAHSSQNARCSSCTNTSS